MSTATLLSQLGHRVDQDADPFPPMVEVAEVADDEAILRTPATPGARDRGRVSPSAAMSMPLGTIVILSRGIPRGDNSLRERVRDRDDPVELRA